MLRPHNTPSQTVVLQAPATRPSGSAAVGTRHDPDELFGKEQESKDTFAPHQTYTSEQKLILSLKPPPAVGWHDSVVDNESFGRNSSKAC